MKLSRSSWEFLVYSSPMSQHHYREMCFYLMFWYDTGRWWRSGGNILNFSFCLGCSEAHSVRSCIEWFKDGGPLSVVLSEQDRIICICEQGLSDVDTCLVWTQTPPLWAIPWKTPYPRWNPGQTLQLYFRTISTFSELNPWTKAPSPCKTGRGRLSRGSGPNFGDLRASYRSVPSATTPCSTNFCITFYNTWLVFSTQWHHRWRQWVHMLMYVPSEIEIYESSLWKKLKLLEWKKGFLSNLMQTKQIKGAVCVKLYLR